MTSTYFSQLDSLSLLRVSGPDAKKFLQGQLTCDVTALNPSQASLAALCSPQGRVQGIFYLWFWQDSYFICLPTSLLQSIAALLTKYAIFSKVTLQPASEHWQMIGCFGSSATIALASFFSSLPTSSYGVMDYSDACAIALPGASPRYLIQINATLASTWQQQLQSVAESTSFTQWHLQDILAGIPTIHPETIDTFTPHQLNLPKLGAVSFKKGCYTGQEIIARMEYRAQLTQHLYRAELNCQQTLLPGTQLSNEHPEETATLIDLAPSNKHCYQCLVILKDSLLSLPKLHYPAATLTLMGAYEEIESHL